MCSCQDSESLNLDFWKNFLPLLFPPNPKKIFAKRMSPMACQKLKAGRLKIIGMRVFHSIMPNQLTKKIRAGMNIKAPITFNGQGVPQPLLSLLFICPPKRALALL